MAHRICHNENVLTYQLESKDIPSLLEEAAAILRTAEYKDNYANLVYDQIWYTDRVEYAGILYIHR